MVHAILFFGPMILLYELQVVLRISNMLVLSMQVNKRLALYACGSLSQVFLNSNYVECVHQQV